MMKKIFLLLLILPLVFLNSLSAANPQVIDICNYLNNEITIQFNASNASASDAVAQAQAGVATIRKKYANFSGSFNNMNNAVTLLLQNKDQLLQYYILVGNEIGNGYEDIENAKVALVVTFPNLGVAPIVTLADGANGAQQLDGSDSVTGAHLRFPSLLSPPTSGLVKALFVPTLQL